MLRSGSIQFILQMRLLRSKQMADLQSDTEANNRVEFLLFSVTTIYLKYKYEINGHFHWNPKDVTCSDLLFFHFKGGNTINLL